MKDHIPILLLLHRPSILVAVTATSLAVVAVVMPDISSAIAEVDLEASMVADMMVSLAAADV